MCAHKIVAMSLAFLVCFINHADAGQAKEVTCIGKVLDAQGRPIAGAKVTAYEMHFDGIAGNFILHQAGEVTTTENGVFAFTSDPKPENSLRYQCYIVAVKQDLALDWAVWKIREDVESDIELSGPAKLEGVILDEAGQPVAGAEVRANLYRKVEIPDGKEKRIWLPGIAPLQELGTITNSQGRFLFDNLPAEVGVDLLVKAEGKATTYTYKQKSAEPAFVAGQKDIRVVLPDEARIEGRIVDPDTGKGIARTRFAVVGGSLFYYRFVHATDDDGRFSVGGLRTGQYLLRNGGFPHTDVDVESGKTTKISVQADRLSRPRGTAGVVRDQEGKLVSNAVVSTYPPVAEEIITDAKGAFMLRAARARTPNARTTYLLVRHKELNLAIVEQLDESAAELDITLAPGAILSGKVVDNEGRVIPGAELSMTLQLSHPVRGSGEKIEIDTVGNYEIRAVPTGRTYSLTASAEGYGKLYKQIDTGGAADKHIELEPLVMSVANLSTSGIVVDEFDRPVSSVRISASGNGQPSRRTLTDAKGRFTVENVCAGQISIYADMRSPRRLRGRAEAEGGATDIKIVVAELDERGRRLPKQPPSLLGKPLPDLKDVKIDLPPANLASKRLLVFFFDMQQRPSRYCLRQLNAKTHELEAKNITVIVVQATKMDEDSLNDLCKKYDISFPVGTIQGDKEKIRFAWGVRSLPWLILTDRQHIVYAEGFAPNKFTEKLKQVNEQ